jgi:cAMP-dependent protein kinase regulator
MDHYERSKMADCVREKKYSKGEMIIKQGEPGNEFYILVEGRAEATLNT